MCAASCDTVGKSNSTVADNTTPSPRLCDSWFVSSMVARE
jgi:hypothetical protein